MLCQQERGSGSVQNAARLGVAPWLLGEVAALLLVFDIFVGEFELMETDTCEKRALRQAYIAKKLTVSEDHVHRAYNILEVVCRIKELAIAGLVEARKQTLSGEERAHAEQEVARHKAAAAMASAIPTQVGWSAEDFSFHTQPGPVALQHEEPEEDV